MLMTLVYKKTWFLHSLEWPVVDIHSFLFYGFWNSLSWAMHHAGLLAYLPETTTLLLDWQVGHQQQQKRIPDTK
jgi:hypothetical protein